MRPRIALFVAVALALILTQQALGTAKTRALRRSSHSEHPQPSTEPRADTSGCDTTLWKHVYNPTRLTKKQACITVTGTIVDATKGKRPDGVRHEKDGDTHGC